MDEGLPYVKKIVHFLNAIKMSRYTLSLASLVEDSWMDDLFFLCFILWLLFLLFKVYYGLEDYGPLTTILNNCVSVMLSLFLLLYFILCLVVLSRHCKHFICCTCDIHPLCVGYARSHWRWGVAFVAVISESASMSLLQFARMSLSILIKLDIETTFNCLILIKSYWH